MEITLVVLAAGQSTRYGTLKQLDQFGPRGETLMDYGVYDAQQVGLSHVVVVTREELLPRIKAHVQRYRDFAAVDLALQKNTRAKPWGTAHAVLSAEPFVSGPFIVVNADDFYGRGAYEQMSDYLRHCDPNDTTFALVPFRLNATLSPYGGVSRAVCTVTGADVTEIVEAVNLQQNGKHVTGLTLHGQNRSYDARESVSMNYWGFTPAIFPLLEAEFAKFLNTANADAEFPISDTINTLLQQRRVRLTNVEANGEWFGVTHPEDKTHVVAALEHLTTDGMYPTPLFPSCN